MVANGRQIVFEGKKIEKAFAILFFVMALASMHRARSYDALTSC